MAEEETTQEEPAPEATPAEDESAANALDEDVGSDDDPAAPEDDGDNLDEDTSGGEAATDSAEAEDKQQSRDDVLTALADWGVEEGALSTLNKLTNKLDFPQFLDQAVKLFPEAEELFAQLDKIEEQGLEESDAKKAKGKAASEKIDELSKKLNIPLTEGQKVVAVFALKAVSLGGKNLKAWFGKGWEDSDLTRLIDAIVQGADYNSAGAMSSKYKEAEKNGNEISANKFFGHLKGDPKDSLDKIRGISGKLKAELNWSAGDKILQNEEEKTEQEVLRDYFLAMSSFMHKSTAEHLLWEKASALIAQEIFEENSVIDPKVLEELHDMNQDTKMIAANSRFIL